MEMSGIGQRPDWGRARGNPAGRVMERLDADRSGGISAGEAAAAESGSRLATRFTRIDADGDGSVTKDELKADFRAYRRDGTPRGEDGARPPVAPTPTGAAPQSLFEALVASADTDGDLRISAEELAANPLSDLLSPAFTRIDTDQDGLLSSREVDAFETPQPAQQRAPQSLYEALVKTTDADGDLRLSASEIAATPLSDLLSPAFAQIDADQDGVLSSREVDAFETAHNAPPAPPAAEVPGGSAQTDKTPATDAPAAETAASTTAPAAETEIESSGVALSSGAGGPAGTYGTRQALSMFESLVQAMAAQPGQDTTRIPRDAARSFLRTLAEIA